VISNAYVTGTVTGASDGYTGGALGLDGTGGSSNIGDVWVSGAVAGNGSAYVGGLIGYSHAVATGSAYWDRFSTGQADAIGHSEMAISGVTSVTSDPSQSAAADYAFKQSAYAGLDFDSIWWSFDGEIRPLLRSEHSRRIQNSHQLQMAALDLGAYYTLGADIDASETGRNDGTATNSTGLWKPAGFVPVGVAGNQPFTGHLDGRGHVVTGLAVHRPADAQYIGGLFGWVSGATITDIGLDRVDIVSPFIAGGFAARVDSGAHIARAYVSGSLVAEGVGSQQPDYVGGLVGLVFDSDIVDSYSNASVATSGVYGADQLAGLASASVNTGISRSYATGHVSVEPGANHFPCALVGNGDGSTYTDVFWDSDFAGGLPGVCSDPSAPGAIGLSTLHWLTQGPVATAAWNLDDVWVAGYPYPVLKALPHVIVVAQGVSVTPGSSTPNVGSYSVVDQDGGDASGLVSGTPTWFVDPAAPADPLPNIGGSGMQPAAGYQLTYASTVLELALAQAAPDYVHYGETVDYVVTLTNSGAFPARGFGVQALPGGGADVGATHWQCIAGSVDASCAVAGSGPIDDSVTIPPGVSMTWLIHVPVSTSTNAGTLDFGFTADGLAPLDDSATIVIFRDGFDGAAK
jgi:hypothetical protein